jgi:hypothetical protein
VTEEGRCYICGEPESDRAGGDGCQCWRDEPGQEGDDDSAQTLNIQDFSADKPSILVPGPAPCGSCPYRQDVPSGVWSAEEYEKLYAYDRPTAEQPVAMFMCHRQDGKLCAGWCHVTDLDESLAVRFAGAMGKIEPSLLDYTTDVPCWSSGTEAAEHGLRDLDSPSVGAIKIIEKLEATR